MSSIIGLYHSSGKRQKDSSKRHSLKNIIKIKGL